ncbi:MAG: hypothetical protein M5U34_23375 [Chloroflexi bacterium]|nr:hypothetical protein [Chloroflexota bacterium]
MLTQLELRRQAHDYGVVYDADEPFWQSETFAAEAEAEEEEALLLPTDTPETRRRKSVCTGNWPAVFTRIWQKRPLSKPI